MESHPTPVSDENERENNSPRPVAAQAKATAGAKSPSYKVYAADKELGFPRKLLDFAISVAREGFVRTGSMGAAYNIMKREVKRRWTVERGASGDVFKEHFDPLDRYLRSSLLRGVSADGVTPDDRAAGGDQSAKSEPQGEVNEPHRGIPAVELNQIAGETIGSAMREALDLAHGSRDKVEPNSGEEVSAIPADDVPSSGTTHPPEGANDAMADNRRVLEEWAGEPGEIAAPDASDEQETSDGMVPLAYIRPDGRIGGVRIETPGHESWGPTNRDAAKAILDRITAVGRAIERYGTPEQRQAWARIKRIVLDDKELETKGVAENRSDDLFVDLSRMGVGGDPRTMDPDFVVFLLVHEIFHSSDSQRRAQLAAIQMQGGAGGKSTEMGSYQWSVEVRHDKMVYDFMVLAGLANGRRIEELAPYYAQHLRNPHVPVHRLPVPGYDQPLP